MKNYFLLFLSLIATLGCSKQEGFVLKGRITGFENGKLVAIPNTPNYKMPTDTIQVVNGEFEYRGKVESPTFIWFLPTITDKPDFFCGSFNLFMGNENITIEGDVKNFRKKGDKDKLIVKGSPSHMEYLRLEELFSSVERGDTKGYIDLIVKEVGFQTNSVIPFFIYSNTSKENVAERERYLSQLDKSLDSNIYVSYLKNVLENEKKIVNGSIAPDFTLKDIDGKEYQLSDFRGKYVLFEFSASWCGWCKKEIPYLQQVYDFGKDKDFVIFTVNLDKTRELWEGEVKKGEVPWLQLSDLQGMSGGIAQQYNITGIPQIFFIDKEGRIINNNLRGDEMVNLIKETLNQK